MITDVKKFAFFSYLVYILIWEGVASFGCAYLVFCLGYSIWLFLPAIFFGVMAYSPDAWKKMIVNLLAK